MSQKNKKADKGFWNLMNQMDNMLFDQVIKKQRQQNELQQRAHKQAAKNPHNQMINVNPMANQIVQQQNIRLMDASNVSDVLSKLLDQEESVLSNNLGHR